MLLLTLLLLTAAVPATHAKAPVLALTAQGGVTGLKGRQNIEDRTTLAAVPQVTAPTEATLVAEVTCRWINNHQLLLQKQPSPA